MIKFFVIHAGIAFSLWASTASAQDRDNHQDLLAKSPDVLSGSWATQIGGNLDPKDFSAFECSNFKQATFYMVYRPVGLGVIHEFVGLVIESESEAEEKKTKTSDVFVTGLNNDTDLEYFQKVLTETESRKKILKRNYSSDQCEAVLSVIEELKIVTKNTKYRDPIAYAAAMASTPWFGQPCSNTRYELEKVISTNMKK